MAKATERLPRPPGGWPYIIDHGALQEALELAEAAAREKNPIRQRGMEREALELWRQAHGRGLAGSRHAHR
jgi:hypothetical protein